MNCIFFSKTRFGMNLDKDSDVLKRQIKEILSNENPDIIHIFGTEYAHSLQFYKAVGDKRIVVCSIQGLVSVIARHYLALTPKKLYNKINFSTFVRGTLIQQQKNLKKRGKREEELLRSVYNVIGRTDWDEACTFFFNENRRYFFCNETMRQKFYQSEWNINKCKKHRIFVSQASSPLKGLNILVEALGLIKSVFTDIEVHIAGNDFTNRDGFINTLKYSVYADYISDLIEKSKINGFSFVGNLDETGMVKEYLECNVFVSCSSIENSSNSICEAMLLGVPVISSDVGGVKTLISDKINGFIYQADAPYMLARLIMNLFNDDKLAETIGKEARNVAKVRHDPSLNALRMIDIYREILNS